MSDACTKVKGRLKNKQTSKQTKNNKIHVNQYTLQSWKINLFHQHIFQFYCFIKKDFAKRIMRHCSLVNCVHSFTLLWSAAPIKDWVWIWHLQIVWEWKNNFNLRMCFNLNLYYLCYCHIGPEFLDVFLQLNGQEHKLQQCTSTYCSGLLLQW